MSGNLTSGLKHPSQVFLLSPLIVWRHVVKCCHAGKLPFHSFLAIEAVIRTWSIDLQWLFQSIHVVPNCLASVLIQSKVNVYLQ